MQRSTLIAAMVTAVLALTPAGARAQAHEHGPGSGNGPHLHVSDRWKECSIQLHSSLSREAWKQFTEEAGLVAYFRPLTDARPMGKGKFELSILQWETRIDDQDAAWNDTFVHPDSTHWLFEGSGLKFPGLTARAGVGDRTDVGVYFTKNPNANYGFFGAQVQQNILGGNESAWAAATRLSFTSLFGPEDVDFTVIGWDVLASRDFDLTNWMTVAPYAGFSSYFTMSREKSTVVDLDNEYVGGSQAMVGAVLKMAGARVAMEYNAATVNSVSMRIGFGR